MRIALVAIAVIVASVAVLSMTGSLDRWIAQLQPAASVEVVIVTPTPIPQRATSAQPTATTTPATSAPTAVPRTPAPTATPAPPTPTPEPTPTPAPTPIPPPLPSTGSGLDDDVLIELRQQMLDLINAARREHGLVEVVLDDNPTAQMHAEDARANCFSGHWGSNGMKPYMRYTLNGGIHSSWENVSGSSYCPPDPHRYRNEPLEREVADMHNGLMNSPGHRRNILHPGHRKVGLGFSFEHPNLRLVQLFTSDHIEFTLTPRIEGGELEFAYRLTNGAVEDDDYPPSAAVFYDPLPHNLNSGQIVRTYCYSLDRRVAAIRPPAGPNSFWPEDQFEDVLTLSPNPYDFDPSSPPAQSYEENTRLHSHAKQACDVAPTQSIVVPWLTSDVQPLPTGGYHVITDLSAQIAQFGPGVYSLAIWAEIDGESAQVANYSIFVETP